MIVPLRFARVRVKILRSGILYVALTLTIGAAAVNTLNNLLYLIVAGLLALMAVSGAAAYLALRRLELELALPDEWFAERSAPVTIRIHNRRRHLSTFLLHLDNGIDRATVVEIPPRGTTEAQLVFRPQARGYVDLGTLTITSEFPFVLFRRGGRARSRTRVLVYPRHRKRRRAGGRRLGRGAPHRLRMHTAPVGSAETTGAAGHISPAIHPPASIGRYTDALVSSTRRSSTRRHAPRWC